MSAGGDSGAPIVFDVNAQPVAEAGAAFDTLGAAMDTAAQSLTAFGQAGEQMLAAFQNLAGQLDTAKSSLDGYASSLESTQAAVDQAASAQQNYISILSGAGTAQTDAAQAAEQLTGSLANVGTSLNDSVGGLNEYNTLVGQVGDAQGQAATASANFGQAIQDNVLALGVAASGILGIVESITRLERAELLAQKASLAFQQALATEASSTLKLQSVIDKYGASSAQAAIASQKLAVAHEKTGLAAERANIVQQQLSERQAQFAIEIIPNVISTVTGMISAFTGLRSALAGVTAANLLASASFKILLASTGVGLILVVASTLLSSWSTATDEARLKTEALSSTFEEFSKSTGTSVGMIGDEFTTTGGAVGDAAGAMQDSISGLAANVPTDLAAILADTASFKEDVVKNLTVTEADKAKVVKVAPGVVLPTMTEAERQRKLGTGVGESQFGDSGLGNIKIPSLQDVTGLPSLAKEAVNPWVEFAKTTVPSVLKGLADVKAGATDAGSGVATLSDMLGTAGAAVRDSTVAYQGYLANLGLTRQLNIEAAAAVAESIAKITQASRTLKTDPRSAFVIAEEGKKLQELIATYNKYGVVVDNQEEINKKAAEMEKAKTEALNSGVEATIKAAAAGEIQLGNTLKLGDVTAMYVEQLGVASQAEQVAIADLRAYAAAHNILIPITAQSASAIQDFIATVEGVGPAAAKAKEEFTKSFFEMINSLGEAADKGKEFWKDMKDSMLPKDFKREVKEKLDVRQDVQQFLEQFKIDAELAATLGASNKQIGKFRDDAIDTINDLQKQGNKSIDLFLQPLEDILKDPNLSGQQLIQKALAWVNDPQVQAGAAALGINLDRLKEAINGLGTAANAIPATIPAWVSDPQSNFIGLTPEQLGFTPKTPEGGGPDPAKDKALQASIDLMKIYNTTATTLSPVTIPAPVKDSSFDSTISGVLTQLASVSGGGGGAAAGGGGITASASIGAGTTTGGGGGGSTALTPAIIPAPDVSAFQTALDTVTGLVAEMSVVFLAMGAAALIANDAIVTTFGGLAKQTTTFVNSMVKALLPLITIFQDMGGIFTLANDTIIGIYGTMDKSTKNFSKAMTKDLTPVVDLYVQLGAAAILSGAAIEETYAILEKETKAWQKPMTKELTPVIGLYLMLGEAGVTSGAAIIEMYAQLEKETKAWQKPMTKALTPIIDLYLEIGVAALLSLAAIETLTQDSVKQMATAQKQLSKTGSQIISTFNSIGSAAASAAGQVNSLASAINGLKDKTVTVTYKQVGKPSQYGRHEVTDTPSLYIAGEAFQPEEVIIRPLWSRGFEAAEEARKRREEERRKYSGIASMMQQMAMMSRQQADNIVFATGGEGGSSVSGGRGLGKIKQLLIELKSDVIVDKREIMNLVRKYLYEIED